jgi:hypothetical protein
MRIWTAVRWRHSHSVAADNRITIVEAKYRCSLRGQTFLTRSVKTPHQIELVADEIRDGGAARSAPRTLLDPGASGGTQRGAGLKTLRTMVGIPAALCRFVI